jgi:replicative DNA helicase
VPDVLAIAPHLLEAERAVLGVALVHPDRVFDVLEAVRPAHFFRDAHRKICQAIVDVSARGQVVDTLTVRDQLHARGLVEDVGGPAYIASLADGIPHSTNVEAYAAIVREQALLRGVKEAATAMLQDASRDDAEARAVLDRAERSILSLAQQSVRSDFIDAPQLVREGFAAVERLLEEKRGVTGVASGFADFDDMTRGFQPGTLALVAARPSMGKTAFALNVAYAAARAGKVIGFFSIEMSRQELFLRLLASVGEIDGHRLQTGYVNQADYGRLSDAMTEIGDTGLFVDDSTDLTVLDVRGKARRLRARRGLDLVIVDYLQLMQLPKAENRNLAVAEASRALKLAARELEVPIIALSQLSRSVETRSGEKKPQLSDLRDSGALEQDADLVVFIHRPEVYGGTPENSGLAEIVIAKQRNGRTGTVKLTWLKEQTRFCNWSHR